MDLAREVGSGQKKSTDFIAGHEESGMSGTSPLWNPRVEWHLRNELTEPRSPALALTSETGSLRDETLWGSLETHPSIFQKSADSGQYETLEFPMWGCYEYSSYSTDHT